MFSTKNNFFFCRILHTMFSHLRAHAFARSVTVARSSAVQASSSRRQERRWAIVCGSPQSRQRIIKLTIRTKKAKCYVIILQYLVQKHSGGILPRNILFVPYHISSYKSHQSKIRSTPLCTNNIFQRFILALLPSTALELHFTRAAASVTESLQHLLDNIADEK